MILFEILRDLGGIDVEVGGRFGLLWEKFLWMVLFIFDGDLE